MSARRSAGTGAACKRRIFVAPIDARLISLDAATGKPCADFGDGGTVTLRRDLVNAPMFMSEYEVTSPPAVIGNTVVVGSAIADGVRTTAPSGKVRAYDARTGQLRWTRDHAARLLVDRAARPLHAPALGTLTAVDLSTRERKWEVPLGVHPALANRPEAREWGMLSLGRPVVTAGGVVFIGRTFDAVFRAFDVETGRLLWETQLPAGGQATPMTYRAPSGKQYVVISAGGYGRASRPLTTSWRSRCRERGRPRRVMCERPL